MAKTLVHIHTGPADPTKATLGCTVALHALKARHEVSIFMAGDGVHLMAPDTIASLEGVGTGKLSELIPAIAAAGGHFYVSGLSAKARGYDGGLLAEHPAEFAMPDVLVRLAVEADATLCY